MAVKKAASKKSPAKKAAAKKVAAPSKPRMAQPPNAPMDSPQQLRTRLDSLVSAWQTAAKTASVSDADRLAKLSAELEAGARSIRLQAEALAESTRISASTLKRIQAAVPSVTPAPTPEDAARQAQITAARALTEDEGLEALVQERVAFAGPTAGDDRATAPASSDFPLESFFQQVSGSVVKAQQRLDMASIAYSQALKDSPVPPSFFSIPKVTAEIKMGLSVDKGSNVLVALFGKPENTTNFSESTVSFDVVASAPPPGGTGIYSAPIPAFLVAGQEREDVAAAIRGIADLIKAKTGVDLSGNPSGWLSTSVVIRAGADAVLPANRADFLFIRRGDLPDKALITVRFMMAKPRDAKIVNVTDPDLRLALFDMVAKVREWEASVTLPPKA